MTTHRRALAHDGMDHIAVELRLRCAFEALFFNDGRLFDPDVSTRSVRGRLAVYLQGVFPAHNVDEVYAPHATDAPRLPEPCGCGADEDAVVVPDLSVHLRDEVGSNLVVLGLKPSTDETPRDCDRARLAAFVEAFDYRFAVLADLPARVAGDHEPTFEWIAGGPK